MPVGISNERQGQLLRAVFAVLSEHPDGLPGGQALAEMARRVPLTEYELGHYKSSPGEPRAHKATRFFTVNCVKAGWLVKSKGTWRLTDEGQAAYAKFTDPGDFLRESSRLYRQWRVAQPEKAPSSTDEPSGDEATEEREAATTTLEEASERAWTQVQAYMMSMDAYDFQELVAALLRAMGYHVHWVSPPGPDRGLDILAFTDPLGAAGPRIKVQVKRRQEKTTSDGLRSFMAILGPGDVGIYISAGGFTTDASREARSQENRRITLIDLERLFDLWVEHADRLTEADQALLPLKPVYFLAQP
ncbi:MAG: restriction system protein [Frankiales bacterium]|jgi:restriction system protein|nr:restriction system protein [Frankiales bacterium]